MTKRMKKAWASALLQSLGVRRTGGSLSFVIGRLTGSAAGS
ncbi:hypothetical protein [Streptomyces flavochromogenes]|nr:hypothetical protein [Streptomyces flavochromogenes]